MVQVQPQTYQQPPQQQTIVTQATQPPQQQTLPPQTFTLPPQSQPNVLQQPTHLYTMATTTQPAPSVLMQQHLPPITQIPVLQQVPQQTQYPVSAAYPDITQMQYQSVVTSLPLQQQFQTQVVAVNPISSLPPSVPPVVAAISTPQEQILGYVQQTSVPPIPQEINTG